MDKFIQHEALHATHMLTEMVDNHLVQHHYYHSECNPEYNKLIDDAIDKLAHAYQICATHNDLI